MKTGESTIGGTSDGFTEMQSDGRTTIAPFSEHMQSKAELLSMGKLTGVMETAKE